MFDRFQPNSRHVVINAQELACCLASEKIEPQHILFAIIYLEDDVTAAVLEQFNINPSRLRESVAELAELVEDGHTERTQIPFSQSAKHVLEHSLREALALGHNKIEPYHLLLATIKTTDNADIDHLLAEWDISPTQIHNATVTALNGIAQTQSDRRSSTPSSMGRASHMTAWGTMGRSQQQPIALQEIIGGWDELSPQSQQTVLTIFRDQYNQSNN